MTSTAMQSVVSSTYDVNTNQPLGSSFCSSYSLLNSYSNEPDYYSGTCYYGSSTSDCSSTDSSSYRRFCPCTVVIRKFNPLNTLTAKLMSQIIHVIFQQKNGFLDNWEHPVTPHVPLSKAVLFVHRM